MGYLEDYRARQRAEAAAAKAAGNGQTPEEAPVTAPRSTQSDETPAGDSSAYVAAAVEKQLEILRLARPGTARTRNTTLFVSAKCLAQLGVDRKMLRRRLLEMCASLPEGNGLIEDDGPEQCRKTIRSGYLTADKEGPREYTSDYIDRINVEEVPMSTFDAEALDEDDATAPPNGLAAGTNGSTPAAPAADTATIKRARALLTAVYALEADFWQRDSLTYIYDCALMRMAPPWGVLANCVARVLVLVGPRVRLPATIGGRGSLNWFGVCASPSGKGKSSSAAVAADLVKGVDDKVRNIGSGEGIAAQYRPPGRNPADHNELMFLCEEIDTLTAMRDRTSSTVTSVLCNGFMGDAITHSYRNNAAARPLDKHGYRMTVIVGAQPGRAGGLLEDRYSGTLQRFQWFPAFDMRCKRATARPGELFYPMQLISSTAGAWNQNNQELKLPDPVTEEILAAAEARAQGAGDALDGHMLFIREKFAFGLAVLDNRTEITEDDWRLAGIAIEISTLTRAWVELEWAAAEADTAARKGRPIGLVQSAAGDARSDADEQKVIDCAKWILAQIAGGPQPKRTLQQNAHYSPRTFARALEELQNARRVELVKPLGGNKTYVSKL